MDQYEQHERFELSVLQLLQSHRILEKLVFGGGTMLRLCHELPRYSVDLDFYFQPNVHQHSLANHIKNVVEKLYTITDYHDKIHTKLIEIKSADSPRRLKLEINKEQKIPFTSRQIAWSAHASQQVPVITLPLDIMMTFKIEAMLRRREIRDAFDIEFLIRRGIPLEETPRETLKEMLKVIDSFKPRDFSVTLGSILPAEERRIYIENKFAFLSQHVTQQLKWNTEDRK